MNFKLIFKQLETYNNGKPFKDSVSDIEYSAKVLEYYAGWADKVTGQTIPVDGPYFTYTRHEPIGVCGQIIPWNYPISLLTWKIGPALACGNTIVVKPAEQTPLSALYIASLIKEAGFPAGVVNVIPGYGPVAGHHLAMHLDVNKISFTGSTLTGRKIQEASAKSNLKRVSLELGGKSPFIIFDVDDETLQRAAEETSSAIFGNQGQSCVASSRVFVHEDAYERFLEKLKLVAEKRTVGDPFDENTTNGALISKVQFERVLDYIKSGKEQGARLITGGETVGNKGYFIKPTIFADCTDDMKIAHEEIFGPVVSVFKFKDFQEAIRRSNGSTYGLAAGVFANDINKVLKVANALEAGTVWVNCYDSVPVQAPFGGFKQSGFGRELYIKFFFNLILNNLLKFFYKRGSYALKEYTEVKNVTIRIY